MRTSNWTYFDEKRGIWQVKCNDDGKIIVVREFKTRGDAVTFCRYGIE